MIGAIAGWLIARNPAMTAAHARRLARIGLVAALVIALGLLAYCTADRIGDTVSEITTAAGENGAREAVIAGQDQTLEQLKDANDAEQDLRSGGERSAARYNECLRNSRNRPGCERYNPDAGQ